MNKKKIIIVGQGISGTFLSWFCYTTGIDFIVIDAEKENTPSRVAAGIINPVTGRRVVKVWLDDILLPFAEKAYAAIGSFLGINAITQTSIVEFFPNPFMRESFLKRLSEKEDYIRLFDDDRAFTPYFNFEFGAGSVEPAYIVNMAALLPAWRNFLKTEHKLIEKSFDHSLLKTTAANVQYESFQADTVIFCDGAAGAANPYFSLLPFSLNKGEAIIIEAPELPADHLYKKSLLLAPLQEPGLFWTGTNYTWEFDNENPTKEFYASITGALKQWLKVPFKIVGHKAAIRPATMERRPFAGFHPVHKNVGILNGMGSKGCSLAPYFAYQLVENIARQQPLLKEADIARFQRILSRTV
ncbi:NAD(P)/FAD-dependent oxidoreductase [Niabella soli]|uniref:FAD-dependent oxidoreductase n=1 Tax=Niabella soli DSM 19437 TaxID=929713 RepID=W0F0M3_9BACT|nr:FAD-dependent oxidoreductase [Niabella soli]AHF15373.1 FAD-dependent oxidoreductase [Niabella soli DSM 19437]